MRHQKAVNHLGRTSAHRKAMLANMASSLIMHKRITTTLAKAKVLRSYIEPLITKAKEDSTPSRRLVFSYLQDKAAVTELFREISVKVASRPGGYTRILKTGFRLGDNADMCIIELVDYNQAMLTGKETSAKKATRRRRSGKKAESAGEIETPKAASKTKAKEKVAAEEVKPVVEDAKDEPTEVVAIAEDVIDQPVEEITAEEKVEEPLAENTEEQEEEGKAEKA